MNTGTAGLTASDIQSLNINYTLTLISYTLLIHEYCITFPLEVDRFWSSKRLTWAIFFFYLNRYLTIFGHIPVIVEYFWYSTTPNKTIICHQLQSYHQYFAVSVQVWVATLLIMRMYALYDRRRRVLALFLGIAGAAVIVACWAILSGKGSQSKVEYFLPVGCPVSLSRDAARRLGVAWGGMLVFDTFVFVLTVYKSFALRRTSGMNLLTLMLRDGSIYFGVMIASNLANILTFVYGGPFTRGVGTTFTNIISSVMITRLMLNLRDPRLTAGAQRPTTLTTAAFRSGNTQIVSTFVDPHNGSEFTEAGWSQQYHPTQYTEEYHLAGTERCENDIQVVRRTSVDTA